MALREAINNDPNQFDRAKNDSMYDAFRPEVNALLNDMYNEVKTNAEKEYHNLEYAVEKMYKWYDSEYDSNNDIQKYKELRNCIYNEKEKLKTPSYLRYVDSVNIMKEAQQKKDEIQASIKNKLSQFENYLDGANSHFNNINDEFKNLKIIKKQRMIKEIYSTWILLFLFIISFVLPFFGILGLISMSLLFGKLFLARDEHILQGMIAGFILFLIYIGIAIMVEFIIGKDVGWGFVFIFIGFFSIFPFIRPDKEIELKTDNLKNEKSKSKANIVYLERGVLIAKDSII